MTHSELPLYPKLSSIYNKIMQLAIAILLLVILLYIWALGNERYQQTLDGHFRFISQQYLAQITTSVAAVIDADKAKISPVIEQMASLHWIKDIGYYDVTGQLIYHSDKHNLISELYGLSLGHKDNSSQYVPFVQEVRTDKLTGYVRLSVERELLIKQLVVAGAGQYRYLGIMLLMAGVVGFLLTRGFNRFSRQGFRLTKRANY